MNKPSRHELTQAGFQGINANRGVDDETLRDLGFDTSRTLPGTINRVRSIGQGATEPIAHVNQIGISAPEDNDLAADGRRLEEVTPEHVPRLGARREIIIPAPRRDKDPRSLLAADQPPESQRPPEWDEGRRLTVVSSDK